MIRQAFNTLTKLQSREATLKRLGSPDITATIRITPCTYSRNLAGPEHIIIRGREFLIAADNLPATGWSPRIKRGDKIVDTDFGSMAIDEIEEVMDLGGAIMGYRVRCE